MPAVSAGSGEPPRHPRANGARSRQRPRSVCDQAARRYAVVLNVVVLRAVVFRAVFRAVLRAVLRAVRRFAVFRVFVVRFFVVDRFVVAILRFSSGIIPAYADPERSGGSSPFSASPSHRPIRTAA